MKFKKSLVSLLLFLSLPFSVFAAQEKIIQLPSNVFIPHGFDNNDHAEVVLHGYFPSTCYRAGPATATISDGNIVIKNMAYLETDVPCLKMIVPWTTTVSVGVLRSGMYTTYVHRSADTTEKFGSLPVSGALSESIDDHLYAYVNGILVKQDAKNIPTLTITGSFSLSCLYLKEIKIVQKMPNVVDVLPIVEIDRSKPCAHLFAPAPYKKSVKLRQALTQKSTLFHVRSMNGQSLNYVTN